MNINNWITILLLVLLLLIFLLKGMHRERLKGVVFSFFSKAFTEEESEFRHSFYKVFDLILFLFSVLVLSLIGFCFLKNYQENTTFFKFIEIALTFTTYFIVRWFVEYLFSVLFLMETEVRFFLVSKSTYLYAISFALYIAVILYIYADVSLLFLSNFTIALFLLRFVIHMINNKKLILSKLFYFILYICTFEIIPLLIIYKLLFLNQIESV